MGTRSRTRTRVVRQHAKGPVDPTFGARIRELRLARRLTQADLAGADFTKGFISLLETGRTRASMRAADILAARLGTSPAELLAGARPGSSDQELLLLRGEQQLAAGQPQQALEFLDRVVNETMGSTKARALRSRGRALVEAGRPREGLASLQEAAAAFETLGRRELVIRTMFDRAVAHAHLDEPGNALALALECESVMRVGGLVDKTLELQLRSFLAATFARVGDLDSADVQAHQAIRLAEDIADDDSLATLYSTLSVARQRQGEFDEALKYARKSLNLYENAGRDRAIGQMWHNIASIHLARGGVAEAEKAIERAARIAASAKIPSLDARVLSLRAEVTAAQRRWKQAEEFARAAIAHPGASAVTKGRALLTMARATANRHGPMREIRERIDEAKAVLANEPPSERAEPAEIFARLMAERGEWKSAYEQMREALELRKPKLVRPK